MKKPMGILKVLICLLVSILIFFNLVMPVSASTVVKEIDIMTTPEKILFDIDNFKPGDWATRTLTIKNSGSEDFKYLTSSNLKSGSKELYNELLLTISDSKGEIYNGKLGEFKKLDPRPVNSLQNEELTFTVKFPRHLGNAYQGLVTEVEFKFYAEGTLGGLLPVDGPKLPETGTNSFNYMIAGIVLLVAGSTILFIIKRKKLKIAH